MELPMRVLLADLSGELHDIRGRHDPDLYNRDDYARSQAYGAALYRGDSGGIVYDSVRHPEGQCSAVFRRDLLANAREGCVLMYSWDGNRIMEVYERTPISDDG